MTLMPMTLIATAVTGLMITALCYGTILWATAGQDSRRVRQARAIIPIAGVVLTLAGTAAVLASFIHAENQMMENFGISPVPTRSTATWCCTSSSSSNGPRTTPPGSTG